jgi:hypothetical protein
MENKNIKSFGEFNENLNISDVSDSDLFQAEYKGEKIKIKGKFLKLGEERDLLQKLKKFNLGSFRNICRWSNTNNIF